MKMNSSKLGKRKAQGFSLVELLVVVVVIGILAAFAAPRYMDSIVASQTSKQAAAVALVEKAKDAYITSLYQSGTLTGGTAYITTFNGLADQGKLDLLSPFASGSLTITNVLKGTGMSTFTVGTITNDTGATGTASRTRAAFAP
jgi:prepilin-type N-terminal cleavage/methylation domain-containing protein